MKTKTLVFSILLLSFYSCEESTPPVTKQHSTLPAGTSKKIAPNTYVFSSKSAQEWSQIVLKSIESRELKRLNISEFSAIDASHYDIKKCPNQVCQQLDSAYTKVLLQISNTTELNNKTLKLSIKLTEPVVKVKVDTVKIPCPKTNIVKLKSKKK